MDYKNEIFKDCDKCDGRTVECNVYTDVSVPIEVDPKIKVGKVDVEPCGEPYVSCDCDCHKGHKIVITQKFLIKIPVCYEVKTCVGESEVDCNKCK